MMRLVVFLVMAVPMLALAQEEMVDPGAFPWADNAVVVLVVTSVLSILSMISRKIPGTAGKVVNWLVDLFSANVKH